MLPIRRRQGALGAGYHALHFSREEAGIDQIAPEVEHAHTYSNEVKKNPAAAPGSCYGRRIALCCAFSFGCLPERAPASDKTLDDEKVQAAEATRQEHHRILQGILACSAERVAQESELSAA